MTPRVAILADIHGNSPAIEAVLTDIRQVGCSSMYVLGDTINGLDPQGCLDLLNACDCKVTAITGNAEQYLLTPDLETFPRRNEPLFQNLIAVLGWWRSHIADAELDWLRNLPDLLIRKGICFVHDSPIDRLEPKTWHIPDIDEQYQNICYHMVNTIVEYPDFHPPAKHYAYAMMLKTGRHWKNYMPSSTTTA